MPQARAFMVGIELKGQPDLLPLEDSLDELQALAQTAGIAVVGEMTQRLNQIEPATLLGPGKVEELKTWRDELQLDIILFDDELSPRHQRNLEKLLGDTVRVLDRTALILDIFAQHAHTREGALQVELAQYEYRLPRLTRQWTHLARQAGGAAGRGGTTGVGLRGPGETQLEVDRRTIRERIAFLKRQLEDVRKHRRQYRVQRRRAQLPVVSIVGYTNAGKSTLLNALSGSKVVAEDKLFATLDPTTRRVRLPGNKLALFTDTVGFIQKLPTQLVAAFRATLEEIDEADLLLHVIDIAHPNAREQAAAVEETLAEIGVHDIPIVIALNKIDRLPDPHAVPSMLDEFPHAAAISAEKRIGLDALLSLVQHELFESAVPVRTRIPNRRSDLIALFHKNGVVEREEYGENSVFLAGRLPARLLAPFRPFVVQSREVVASQLPYNRRGYHADEEPDDA
ncbi:MAG TPA: GTPase HflX [Anaerolineae bacterium]|nr:GTPase HflX [Anaerolineae bacterium]